MVYIMSATVNSTFTAEKSILDSQVVNLCFEVGQTKVGPFVKVS